VTTVFPPSQPPVTSGRIRLSHLTVADVDKMPWLAAVLAPDWQIDALIQAVEAGAGILISNESDLPIGVAIVLLGQPRVGTATVPVIGIDPSQRFRGLGSEAIITIERYLRAQFGVQTVYAPVPDGRGLAVYFWLRQGYRPLTKAEGPGPLIGLTQEPRPGIWMVRDNA
jgi:hypothetical protein